MAKFTIYNPSGGALYEGTPTYSGSYMEPGQLVFRNVAVPFSVDFPVGCYVDYSLVEDEVETRTGNRYKIYTAPAVTKQARQGKVGDAIVYDNIVLYDAAKSLEFCPFRDIVQGDNNVHYSTQESWSTYEAVEGIRKRIQAVVDSMFPNTWSIQLATRTQAYQIYLNSGRSAEDAGTLADEYEALVEDAREFTFSGGSVLDALKRIYDVWKEVGWKYYRGVVSQVGTREIIFIGPGGGGNPVQYLYGKGNGLKSLKRSVANEGELCNRIYPFGNTTNISSDWYRRLTPGFAYQSSADIQHLLPPKADWGTMEVGGILMPTPLKAYYEDANSIARNGLRPKYVYFDGSDDREDIYPTIKGLTVGDIRAYISGGGVVDYPPSQSFQNSMKLDRVYRIFPDENDSSVTTFDSGLAGEDGKATLGTKSISKSNYTGISYSTQHITLNYSFGVDTIPEPDEDDFELSIDIKGLSAIANFSDPLRERNTKQIVIRVAYTDAAGATQEKSFSYEMMVDIEGKVVSWNGANEDPIKISVYNCDSDITVQVKMVFDMYVSSLYYSTYYIQLKGILFAEMKAEPRKRFIMHIPPFGYDLKDVIATEGEVKIKMTSGKCAGREFKVKTCTMQSSTNILALALERQYDESLSQYFPNSDYTIADNLSASADSFVILGIVMPDFYITAAANKLKAAAQDYLAKYSTETWQYTPEIDSKFMQESHRTLRPGYFMKIVDPDIVAEEGESNKTYLVENNNKYELTAHSQYIVLADGTGGVAACLVIDSVTIDESGALPSWKVTLRNRKYVPKYQIVNAATVTQLGRKSRDLIIKR